jgi:DNA-binding PadR family transcriptional regulator
MRRRFLTDLELMVLLATLRVGENAYGIPIARELHETAGRNVALAVVYATLDRLEHRALVSSSLGEPTPERGGRAKRVFCVTAKGVREARASQRAFSALWRGVLEPSGGMP